MGCNINTTFTTNTIRVTMQAGGGSGGSGTDELVKVSSDDIAAEYLEDKITAGDNITINKITDSNGVETLEVAADVPTSLSNLSDDSTHRTVTDTEKSEWNGKADLTSDEIEFTLINAYRL